MKKILGISLVAMMAVTTARADIASKAYVDTNFQAKALETKTTGFTSSDWADTTHYPSLATAKAIAETVAGGVGSVELTGYSKGSDASAVAATDTLNQAVSKLENQIDAKQDIQIGAAGDAGKAVVVASDGKIGMSTNTLGDAAYKNVTSSYSASGTDPITGTGVAAALGTLGTMASEAAADYTKTADMDSSVSATTGEVVTAISMADGVLSTTTADPLSVTSYSVGHDGKYALTAVVSGGAITGYKWELITRDGTETEPVSGY